MIAAAAENAAPATPPHLIRLKEVMRRVDLGKSALYELMARDATFPKPIHLSARAARWYEAEVSAWIIERVAQRDAMAA